jgi:hypothetical protein
MKERFCPYCQNFRKDEGFKTIVHPNTGSKRGMCNTCQSLRQKPRKFLTDLAERDRTERKAK